MNSAKASLAQQAGTAFLWRSAGEAAEKLIFLARLFVLARLVAPADFGLVAIGMTALSVTACLTDFGLVRALVQAGADDRKQLDTAWTAGMVRAAVINAVLFATAPLIAALFGETDATNIVRALALTTLIDAAASIEIATATRQLRYRALTTIQLSDALVNTVVSIYLASSLGAWALVVGAIAGSLTYMLGSYVIAPHRPRLRFSRSAAEQLLRFGRWIFVAGLIAVASETVLRWVISRQLGVAELGLFFMATRLAFLPAHLTGAVFQEVAFPVYARVQHDAAKIARAYSSTVIGMLVLLLPGTITLLVLIPSLIANVLGEAWQGATQITQLLLIAALVGLLGNSFRPLAEGTGRPDYVVYADGINVVVLLLTSWIMTRVWGLTGAGLAYLVSIAVAQLAVIHFLKLLVRRPFAGLFPVTAGIGAVALIAAGVAALATRSLAGSGGLVLAVVAAGVAGVAAGLVIDRVFGLELVKTLTEPFPQLGAGLRYLTRGRLDAKP